MITYKYNVIIARIQEVSRIFTFYAALWLGTTDHSEYSIDSDTYVSKFLLIYTLGYMFTTIPTYPIKLNLCLRFLSSITRFFF